MTDKRCAWCGEPVGPQGFFGAQINGRDYHHDSDLGYPTCYMYASWAGAEERLRRVLARL